MIYSCLFMHNAQLDTKSYPVSLPATMKININLQLDKVEVNHTAQRWHSVSSTIKERAVVVYRDNNYSKWMKKSWGCLINILSGCWWWDHQNYPSSPYYPSSNYPSLPNYPSLAALLALLLRPRFPMPCWDKICLIYFFVWACGVSNNMYFL